MLYLSVDFGTSAVKMSLLDENANTKAWSKEEYHYLILPGEKNELLEEDLFSAFYRAAGRLPEELKQQVEILCYDTFSPSSVFMDRDGNLVYPNIITHLDRRSREQSRYIDETFGRDAYREISGIYPFPGGCSAMTFLWFREHMPEVLERSFRIGHLTTLIHQRFTGEWMVDLVNASMMGMYETTTQGTWSKELMSAFALREDLFGEICLPGTKKGVLKKEIADQIGVPAGIPVTVGTNDVAAAQMGAGNTKAGGIMNTTGSSEMVSILVDKAVTNPEYYLRNAALPGLWQIYVTTCGGFGVEWFREQFCREMSKEEFYVWEEACIDGWLSGKETEVAFDPYLTGDRQSLEKKTGSFRGLTLAATREDMMAAYLVSVQDVLSGAIRKAAEVTDLSGTVKISGGMATDAYIRLKEKCFGEGYLFERVDDCPIIGNIRLAQYYE